MKGEAVSESAAFDVVSLQDKDNHTSPDGATKGGHAPIEAAEAERAAPLRWSPACRQPRRAAMRWRHGVKSRSRRS
jgi:hypothetical protein